MIVVLLLVGLVVVGLVAYGGYLQAKRRREGMAALAQQRGWTYTERDDSWAERFDGPPFGIGSNRKAENIVRGLYDGRKFIAFDYWYSTLESSGKSVRTERHPYSIIAISTQAVLPRLSVVPEGMFSRFVGRITGSDIELESEQFNRAFTVRCEDRKFATDVLHPRMMEFLLTVPHVGWTLRNGSLMIATPGQHDRAHLDGAMAVIDAILDLVPGFVWSSYGVSESP